MEKKQTQSPISDMTAGEILGWIGGMALLLVVLGFLALHSMNAFVFIFKDGQEYLAPLGFGMTGGAAVVYLIKLINSSKATNLKKTIYFIMLVVCGVGEVLTAQFGMKLSAFETGMYVIPQETIDTFFLLVQALAFLHFLAIIGEFAGDTIAEMFSGIKLPFFGRKENTEFSPAQTTVLASDTEQLEIVSPNGKDKETVNPTKGERH